MRLSIVIPAYNEICLVGELLSRVMAAELPDGWEREVVVVDDGSTDGTLDVVTRFCSAYADARLVRHERNLGKGAAVRTGFMASSGEVVIVQDADLEYDPNEIPTVVKPVVEGGALVVYGSRILMEKQMGRSGVVGLLTGKHPHSYVLAYLGGVTITHFLNLLTGASLTDEPTCYKCFHRSVLDEIEIECDDFSWEPEVTMKVLRNGHEIQEVPISYHPRKNHDGKKINWRHGVAALWAIWRFRFREVNR